MTLSMLVSRDEFTDVYWVPLTVECYLNCCDCNNCKMSMALESGTCLVKYSVQQLLSKGIYPHLTGEEKNDLFLDSETKGQEMRRRAQSKGLLLKFAYTGGPYSFSEEYDLKVYKSKVGHPMFNVAIHYQDYSEMAERIGRSGLESLYKKMGKSSELFNNPKSNLIILAKLVWKALEEIAEDLPIRSYTKQSVLTDEQIREVKEGKKSPGRPKMIQESRIITLSKENISLEKLPPQAQSCVIILRGLNKFEFTIQELKDIFNDAQQSGKLKTKQNPYRIFDYYKNRLKQRGVIDYD